MSGLTRRSFLKRSGAGGVTVLGASAASTMLAGCPSGDPNSWLDTYRRQTLDALADTILPNEAGDGGAQARAIEVIFDPYYSSNGWIDEVISEADTDCNDYYGHNFKDCTLAQRTESLQWLTTYDEPWYASDSDGKYRTAFQGMILLTKLAWFGGLVNNVGTNYLGYPGMSGGYTAAGGSTPAVGTASGNWYQTAAVQILDNSYNNSWLYVSGTGTVREVCVTSVIQHTYQGDLIIKLYSPAGTSYTLWNRAGGGSDDLYFTNQRITTFDNQTAQGWWRLEVQDCASNDSGWIHQFGLHLTAR
jgi:hypothetical protein